MHFAPSASERNAVQAGLDLAISDEVMTCFFPLQAFKGKSQDASKIAITFSRPQSWKGERLALPCGQCVGCRLERSRQWAVRCVHEASLHEDNSFLTLTYDDAHRPKDGSLCLEDFQLFMKRLRKSIAPRRVRFFHCGEYGDSTARPHYHALLFGYDFSDKRYFSKRSDHVVYTSDELSRLWTKGFAVTGGVSFESAAYVARYVMKKVTGADALDHYQGRKPEYITMSRRPGIGAGWFKKYSGDVYPLDRVVVRGHDTRPPRFYDSLLGKYDPSTLALMKIAREKNERFVTDVLTDGTVVVESDSSLRRLLVKNEVKIAEISTLKRHLE